ncbi:MAG: aminotransferase class III-fold pyridoxal phosphate-dependent enzyme [Granulosicoccus sp.]|nr:aminotransferase class III-fold pyridoxal phosphate-dependent enzyme [Granulosicoccus sp.]
MTKQADWINRANVVLPAGGFGNFDSNIIIKEARASRIWDEDGNEFIDYLIGSGPMLLGHGHPEVIDAVQSQLGKGMTFFANNAAGIELAEAICEAVPCAEQVRYVTSGGEADMYALRLARAFTGRNKILKFEGGYHGMSAEAQMSLAPEILANFPQAVPDSAGIPESVSREMLIAPFNDIDSVRSLLDEYEDDVAAIIVEPLQRVVPPAEGFLQALREECSKRSIVLIFDEIVTGFRLAYGGAQEAYGVVPDICTLGKIIGGGFALAAIAGSKEIMNHFDVELVGKDKFLMQLGTLSGNPVAAVAGLKTMEILRRDDSYTALHSHGEQLMSMISGALTASGHAHQIVGHPGLFDVVFTQTPVKDYRSYKKADSRKNAVFNTILRENGVFKSPAKLYPNISLTPDDLDKTQQAVLIASQDLSARIETEK